MSLQDDKTFSFYTENYTCYFDTVEDTSEEEALKMEGVEAEENEKNPLAAEVTIKAFLGMRGTTAFFRVEMMSLPMQAVTKLIEVFE